MFFRKKSKAAAPLPQPTPVPAPLPPAVYMPAGEPDLRGLGSILWRKKALILGITLCCAGAAFVIGTTRRVCWIRLVIGRTVR